jgi:hypothetical protein
MDNDEAIDGKLSKLLDSYLDQEEEDCPASFTPTQKNLLG